MYTTPVWAGFTQATIFGIQPLVANVTLVRPATPVGCGPQFQLMAEKVPFETVIFTESTGQVAVICAQHPITPLAPG